MCNFCNNFGQKVVPCCQNIFILKSSLSDVDVDDDEVVVVVVEVESGWMQKSPLLLGIPVQPGMARLSTLRWKHTNPGAQSESLSQSPSHNPKEPLGPLSLTTTASFSTRRSLWCHCCVVVVKLRRIQVDTLLLSSPSLRMRTTTTRSRSSAETPLENGVDQSLKTLIFSVGCHRERLGWMGEKVARYSGCLQDRKVVDSCYRQRNHGSNTNGLMFDAMIYETNAWVVNLTRQAFPWLLWRVCGGFKRSFIFFFLGCMKTSESHTHKRRDFDIWVFVEVFRIRQANLLKYRYVSA